MEIPDQGNSVIELTQAGKDFMESERGTSEAINASLKQFYIEMKDQTGISAWDIKKAFFNANGNVGLAKSLLRPVEVPAKGLRLNVAAGNKRIDGWVGIDATERSGADIIAPMDAIPLPDACATDIMVIHAVEHVYAWEVPGCLSEWFRLLRPGGKLVLEMPDLLKACKNIAEGYKGHKHPDQQQMWAIFGDDRLKDPLMIHKSGWWFDRLKPLVETVGFIKIREADTQFHGSGRKRRDFRLEAKKP